MDNFLNNGTILPTGLISPDSVGDFGAFQKTFQNTSLRVGIVKASYDIDDPNNITKFVPEYDVFVFEQNEDKSSTAILYKNCIAASSFGSIADFFEARLRSFKTKTTKDPVISPSGQNGAIVLLLCMNGLSDRGIIIKSLLHPDRKTTLTGSDPHLEGEYNGVHILIDKDGSATLTFKGATDNDGKVIDSSQGNTTLKIEKDGSFQVDHSTITFRLDKDGDTTLTASGDVDLIAKGDCNLNITGDVNIKCANATVTAKQIATVEGTAVKLGKSAIEAVIKGVTFKAFFDTHIHPTPIGPTGPPIVQMPPATLSLKVKTE